MASASHTPTAAPRRATVPTYSTKDMQQLSDSRNQSYLAWLWQDDDGSWKPYGELPGSPTFDEIEKSYQKNSSGKYKFSFKGQSYVISFAFNTQTNKRTFKQRKVERRMVQYVWYWQDDNGEWKQYDSTSGGVTSAQISASFHESKTGKLRFELNGSKYVIKFKSMKQKNKKTKESRKIKWEVSNPSSTPSAADRLTTAVQPSSNDWYWQANDNTWHPFVGTISSDLIEAKFIAKSNDSFAFQHGAQSYQIDLQTMTQTNLKTGKKRPIVRKPKGQNPN